MAPRLSTRSLRSQPKLSNGGAAADLFSAKKPDIKIVRAANRDIAEAIAKRVFQNIARELGHEEARDIFSKLGAPVPKKQLAAMQNRMILDLYVHYGRPPVKTFARWLAKVNKTLPPGSKFAPRGGYSGASLQKQLRRLLLKIKPHSKPTTAKRATSVK